MASEEDEEHEERVEVDCEVVDCKKGVAGGVNGMWHGRGVTGRAEGVAGGVHMVYTWFGYIIRLRSDRLRAG